jgi:hypothetical protein
VSHASEDYVLAAELHEWLLEDGHEVFLDQDFRDGIALGDEWEPRLHERLRWADAVVCLVTASYRKSLWCAAEVGIARSRGSRLLQLRAEHRRSVPIIDAQPISVRGPGAGSNRSPREASRSAVPAQCRGWLRSAR